LFLLFLVFFVLFTSCFLHRKKHKKQDIKNKIVKNKKSKTLVKNKKANPENPFFAKNHIKG